MKKNVLCVLLLLPILTSCQSLRTRLNPFNDVNLLSSGYEDDVPYYDKKKVIRNWYNSKDFCPFLGLKERVRDNSRCETYQIKSQEFDSYLGGTILIKTDDRNY